MTRQDMPIWAVVQKTLPSQVSYGQLNEEFKRVSTALMLGRAVEQESLESAIISIQRLKQPPSQTDILRKDEGNINENTNHR